jgi:hypothetical protein
LRPEDNSLGCSIRYRESLDSISYGSGISKAELAHDLTDRPALEIKEIEITPELIEAGVDAFYTYYDHHNGPEDAVAEIFQ